MPTPTDLAAWTGQLATDRTGHATAEAALHAAAVALRTAATGLEHACADPRTFDLPAAAALLDTLIAARREVALTTTAYLNASTDLVHTARETLRTARQLAGDPPGLHEVR